MISFKEVSINFKNEIGVKDVTFEIGSDEFVFLIGPTGSGKTTLGMAVLRLIKSNGQINFFKKNQKLSINNFNFKNFNFRFIRISN